MKRKQKSNVKSIYDPKYDYIIKRLKVARKEAGFKQEYVAERIKKYASYISKIENGDRRLDVIELIELAALYKKDINFFIP
jgi:transcriptional regulator with XRE-family HTH domain